MWHVQNESDFGNLNISSSIDYDLPLIQYHLSHEIVCHMAPHHMAAAAESLPSFPIYLDVLSLSFGDVWKMDITEFMI